MNIVRRGWLFGPFGGLFLLACSAGSPTDGDATGAGGTGTPGDGGSGGQPVEAGGGGGDGGNPVVDPCDGVDCPDGEVCDNGECVTGCETAQDCGADLSCCSGACIDVATNVGHCGMCDEPCPTAANLAVTCETGLCQNGGCEPGFYDCNGTLDDGCESDAECSCQPGEQQECYEGPPGTAGDGICTNGYRICNATGTAWSLCFDWVGPVDEICGNGIDEDCSGTPDDVGDLDGDGWTRCNGDCCENMMQCGAPASVNPGAFEFVGNGVNDDCDAASSDTVAPAACSTSQNFAVTPLQMAQAMDICQQTTANAPLPTKKWGLINAQFLFANGTTPNGSQLTNIQNFQAAVLQDYGTGGVVPRRGPTMAGLSTGRMRDATDTGYIEPNGGTNFGVASTPPAAYLAQHGGALPSAQSCAGNCPPGSGARDPVNLRLTIRVPTNAQSLSYDFRFFSAEYWQFSCTEFNDFYLALYQSNAAGIPPDRNISFDNMGNNISVNNGFYDHCQARACYTCPLGTGALGGTGLTESVFAIGRGTGMTGGGTTWLTTTAPVVPGETIVLELMIFDVEDNILDSISLLDSFQWSVMPSGVGTGPAG